MIAPRATDRTPQYYAEVFWRRKYLIALVVIVIVGLAIGRDAISHKVYGANAEMQVVSQEVSLGGGVTPLQPSDIATDIQLVQSSGVVSIVEAKLGRSVPTPGVTEVGTTEVLNINESGTNAAFAARAANAFVAAYIQFTASRFANQIEEQKTILQSEATTLQSQISTIETEIAANSAIASTSALNTQLNSDAAQLEQVNTSLIQLQLDQSLVRAGALQVSPAIVDTTPISPRPLRDGLIAGLLGLLVGAGLALFEDFFDDRIRNKEMLFEVSGNVPLLGEIPEFDNWKSHSETAIIANDRPKSAAAEAYRSLRTAVQFIGFDTDHPKVIQITSPTESEGKTTTVIDLAVTMASSGSRVAVVSCDLRRPGLHKFFKVSESLGVSSILSGLESVESVVVVSEDFPNLMCIPSGPIPPNPSELLGSPRLADLFESLRAINDVILVDSPPVLPVTDAIVIAQSVDFVVLIARAGQTHARAMARALELLANVDAPVKGVVLNALHSQPSGRGYGGYGGYGGYSSYGTKGS